MKSRFLFLLLFPLAALPAVNSAQALAIDPVTVMAQAKEAAGGTAWDSVRTFRFHSKSAAGGLTGVQDEWDDVQTGRFAVRFERSPAAGANGFDGVSIWTQAADGYGYTLGDEDAQQGAINEAYQTCRAFWFPERGNAALASAGQQEEAGHTYDVVSVTPQAGRPFTVWVDQTTHLIDRFVEQQGEDVQITRMLDYHTVPGGIKLPFTVRIGDGDARWDEVDTMQTVTVNAPLAPDQFTLPPTPAPDFRFLNGKTSTTIPFRLIGDKLLVSVKINGQGPFEAEFDSGGHYIIQPALAKRLNLVGQGSLQEGGGGESFVAASRAVADTVDLGDVRLTHQSYKIIPFRGSKPEQTLIGLQILQRFVVSINFDRHLLTLTRPEQFVYHGTGTVIPFHFQDNQPEVNGAVDGIAGVFTIDTGDDGSLLLIAPFAKRYDLVRHYSATIPYGGTAMGGATHGVMTRAGGLALFGPDGRPAVEVHDPLTRISQQKGGFDADRYVSGNVGIGILSQFNMIFDYSRQQIILEKNQSYGRKDIYNRSGLQLKRNQGVWDVLGIVPGSPAAEAGIHVGDTLLAISGLDTVHLSPDQQYDLFLQPVGTKVSLAVQSDQGRRSITLVLHDVL